MSVNAWLSGAICMAALVIALFFVRYWRQSRDKLFIYFALAFVLEAAQRMLQAWPSEDADAPQYFLLRLLEYGLILAAIIQKNRSGAGDRE